MDTSSIFWVCAVFGTTILVLQLVLMSMGFAGDDAAGDVYTDTDTASGTEDSFKILSIQTISAFFTAFGWGGLSATEQFKLSPAIGTLIAVLLGLAFVYIMKSIFVMAMKLSAPGATYSLDELVGKETNVYQKIPSTGAGKLQMSLGGMIREISAESEGDEEIPSGTKVEITAVVDPSLVKVKRK